MKILKRTAVVLAVLVFLASAGYLSARQAFRKMARDIRIQVKASDTPSEVAPLMDSLSSSIGDIVFLREIRIEPGPAAGLFFVVDRKGNKMAVRSDTLTMKSFAGKMANLTGAITRFPSLATMQHEWKLQKPFAAEMRQQIAYIRADRVSLAAPAPRAH